MANEVRSEEYAIIISGRTFARGDDFSLTANKTEIDITSLDSSGFTELLVGNKTLEVSSNATYTLGSDFDVLLQHFMTSNNSLTLVVNNNKSGSKYLSGNAHLLSLEKSGSKDDVVKFSAKLKYTGNVQLLEN